MLRRAFDLGVTHFDLANNYGPPYGSAEENFGRLMAQDFRPYRDELVISTKAGYDMWPGPYGEWGSRKYLLASLDQSLRRMGLDYVDIFYSHRVDPETPLEETMGALDTAVRQGKALYAGISSYSAREDARGRRDPPRPRHAAPHPPAVVLDAEPLDRGDGLLDALEEVGAGCIVFSPLAQGMLSTKYLNGIPEGSRASRPGPLSPEHAHRGGAGEDPRAERDRRRARSDAGADGDRLDAARPARHLGAAGRVERRSRSRRTSPRSTGSTSATRSWPRSTATRPTAASTSGPPRARSSSRVRAPRRRAAAARRADRPRS